MLRRGEIHFVSLEPVQGHEQGGVRPVLVVSADAINRLPLVVTVVAGTDARNVPVDYSTNVRVRAAESGLPLDTVFLCYQVRSLDPSRFRDGRGIPTVPAGRLPPDRMADVERALSRVLDLDSATRGAR